MKTAIFPSSHWGSNIGNVFFYMGTKYILEKSHPEIVVTQSDLPPSKAFGLTEEQCANDVGYGYRLGKFDYLVLDGPMFDKNFEKLFGPYLVRAKELGIRVVIMSAGGIDYNEEEIEHCRAVLKKYPPYVMTTRDKLTYDNYHDLCENSYNAICSAWFIPDAYPGYEIPGEGKYVTVCFDHTPEPDIEISGDLGDLIKSHESISIGGVTHSKVKKVSRLAQRGFASDIGGYQVIRPCHQVLNRQNWRLFFKKNSYCSQVPWGYLNLYRNTSLTVTDRLHAAVATMAYGNTARLYIKSKRTYLLDRVGAREVCNGFYRIDQEYLMEEKLKYLAWMKKVFN